MGPVPPTGTKTIRSGSLANLACANNSLLKPFDAVFLLRKEVYCAANNAS